MVWTTICGEEHDKNRGPLQTFHLRKNGNTLEAILTNSRLFVPKIGTFQVRLNMKTDDHATVAVDDGYLGLWWLGKIIFVIHKQPGPHQRIGIRIGMDGSGWRQSSAENLLIEMEGKVPKEVIRLMKK